MSTATRAQSRLQPSLEAAARMRTPAPHTTIHESHRHRAARPSAASRSQRDEPILAAAIRQGIGLPYGCRDGACGSCKSRLLEGRVIHGAHQLKALSAAEEEAGLILPCCATPQTDCVIEARTRARRRRVSGAEDAVPRDERSSGAAPDVAVLRLQLPANQALPVPRRPVRRVHPARRLRGAAIRWPTRRSTARQRRRRIELHCATCRAACSPTMCSAR